MEITSKYSNRTLYNGHNNYCHSNCWRTDYFSTSPLAGRWRVGAERAKFTDALWITALGVVVSVATNQFVGSGIGSIIQLVVYLYLVQKYYETDWVNAAVIAVLTVVILFVATIVLAMVGVAVLGPGLAGIV